MNWLGGALTAIKLGWKYRAEIIGAVRAAISLVKTIQAKIEERKRHAIVDKAAETKNPEALEGYLGGGPRP